MSDRVAAAEAILATLTTARARMTALANAHLPFDRALALELRATVGASPERLQYEWTSSLLDQSRALWRAGLPGARLSPLPERAAPAPRLAPPVFADEEVLDEDTHETAASPVPAPARPRLDIGAPEVVVLEPAVEEQRFDQEPDLAPALGVGDEPPTVEEPILLLGAEITEDPPSSSVQVQIEEIDEEVEYLEDSDDPEEPVEQESTQQQTPVGAPLVSFVEPAVEPEPATEESLTEEASEEPAPVNFDYLVRFVEPSRTPAPPPVPVGVEDLTPEPELESDSEPGPSVVLLSDEDVGAPEEDDLLDEAMEKALDGDEPSVVGGQLVFDYSPPVVDAPRPGVEDGGTEGADDEPEPLVELGGPATVVAAARPRAAFEDDRTLPTPPPVRDEEPSPPPRRDAPRSPTMAFTPVVRGAGRAAPEFNPALEVAAEESDDLLSPEPDEQPVVRSGGGFAVTLERPTGPAVAEEEYDEPSDEAPPVNAPRLTDEADAPSLSYDSGASGPSDVDRALAADFLRQAREAELSGNLSKAIMFYQDLLDLTPENMEGYLGRGRCFMEMGDYAAAMSDFQRAEDLDTRSPEPLVEMGNLFFARKEYRRAIEFYDQAIELDPTHAMARCRRGICHHYRKNHKQAFQDLQRAYSLNPDIPNIRKYVQMAVKAMEKPK